MGSILVGEECYGRVFPYCLLVQMEAIGWRRKKKKKKEKRKEKKEKRKRKKKREKRKEKKDKR